MSGFDPFTAKHFPTLKSKAELKTLKRLSNVIDRLPTARARNRVIRSFAGFYGHRVAS